MALPMLVSMVLECVEKELAGFDKIPINGRIDGLSLEINKNTNLVTKYSSVQVASGNWKCR